MFLKTACQPLMEKLLHDKSAGIAGPTCIISDMFHSWTLDVAEKLELPRYLLMTSGVTCARIMRCCLDYFDGGQFQIAEVDGKLVEFDWLVCSGLPTLHYYELNHILRQLLSGQHLKQ